MTKQPRHVMIDIETMGKTPECAIVSIGAVVFDPRYGLVTDNTFYVELDYESQGRRVCEDTKSWWIKQSPEAKEALFGLDDLDTALEDLAKWLPADCKLWGNGATFDISFLEDAYRQVNQEVPWKYWNIRDCRTILDMYESKRGGFGKSSNRKGGGFGKSSNRKGAHNALQDAIYQAKYVTMMWSKLLGEGK